MSKKFDELLDRMEKELDRLEKKGVSNETRTK